MQLKRSGPAPSHKLTGGQIVSPPPSTRGTRHRASDRHVWRSTMTVLSRRSAARFGVLARRPAAVRDAFAADKPKEIRIDWATYNPVSMVLKDKGLLEKEFAKDGIDGPLGADARLQQGAASSSMPARSTSARPPAPPRWSPRSTATRSSRSTSIRGRNGPRSSPQGRQDHQDRRPQGQARRGDARHRSAHLPGARAAERSASPTRTSRRCCCSSRDGSTALIRGDVDAWAGLDPMMAQAEVEDGARLFYRKPRPTPGASSTCARSS